MQNALENVRVVKNEGSTERWLDEQPHEPAPKPTHPLSTPASEKKRTRLLEWYNNERERQAPNRYQMALDHDYYDNLQWSEEDAQEVIGRGQAPLVYNEIAPTIDWIVGTEKRTRVDFKVLPRSEDDVETADAKTKTLKWLSDINKTAFKRSHAFADAVKGGMGWLEDGVRADPDEEPIYSRSESWKNMLHDSYGVERDLSDSRYLFRVKWVDLDVAIAIFPTRRRELEQAAIGAADLSSEEDEDFWYLGQHFQARDQQGAVVGRRVFVSDASLIFNRRARVKLIECWYREPCRCQIMHGEVFNGQRYNPREPKHRQAVEQNAVSLFDANRMEMRCAVMTEGHLLQDMASPYKHNRFPFTPIWCYRRSRDGQPYGVTRRVRDPQDDLNKRSSKALFLLSTNRVIVDEDAVEDHDEAREEAARPDAYIIKKRGAEFRIDHNAILAEEHLMLMDRNGRMIRQAGGVTDDNLGRASNAISGEAIKARQLQGSVVTAEVFDNLRFAVQNQGEVQLSLAEQFITEPKVIRLTQARGQIEWTKINQPEQQPDRTWRYVNDITASQADFVVDQQDFAQSSRQAMFDSMVDLVSRIASVSPDAALRILKMALEFSDLPNKEDMAQEIAAIAGIDQQDKDPAKMNPQELAAWKAEQQAKQEAMIMQKRMAVAEVALKEATADKAIASVQQTVAAAGKLEIETAQIVQEMKIGMQAMSEQLAQIAQAVMGTPAQAG